MSLHRFFHALEVMLLKLCPVGPGRAGVRLEAAWCIGRTRLCSPLLELRSPEALSVGLGQEYLT